MEKILFSNSINSDQVMGLKHLAFSHHESDQAHVMTSSMLSRTSSSSSSAIGECLGTESCFDVLSEEKDAIFADPDRNISTPCRRKEVKAAAREFPPPIPSLARTENLPPHMPWVLTRHHTSDGRLILREERVRHHEYFRALRSNGCLTLQLVPLDDDDDDGNDNDNDDDAFGHDGNALYQAEEDQEEDKVDVIVPDDAHDDDVYHDEVDTVFLDDASHNGDDVHTDDVKGNVSNDGDDDHRGIISSPEIGGGGSPGGKCLKSYFLGMQLPKIRPVLS